MSQKQQAHEVGLFVLVNSIKVCVIQKFRVTEKHDSPTTIKRGNTCSCCDVRPQTHLLKLLFVSQPFIFRNDLAHFQSLFNLCICPPYNLMIIRYQNNNSRCVEVIWTTETLWIETDCTAELESCSRIL